ncbi:MAG: hypothetical protein WDM78_03065 [Puia sp.]
MTAYNQSAVLICYDGIPLFNEMAACIMYTYLNGYHFEIIGGFYYQVVTGLTMIIDRIYFSDFGGVQASVTALLKAVLPGFATAA